MLFQRIIPSLEVKICDIPSSIARSEFTVDDFGKRTFITVGDDAFRLVINIKI